MAMHLGRSRRAGERYPGGKIKPRDEGDVRAPTLWRRIKDGAVKGGAHPYAGTVLGRLSIFGLLADAEVEAGFRVAEIVGRYERLSGAPRRTCASPAYERGFGFSLEGQVLAERSGVLFPPGIFLDGEPFSYGRLSERKLRRELEQRLRSMEDGTHTL